VLDEDPRWGLAGDTIWVTGASSGIGEQTARLLGRAGARVVLSARSEEALETLADEIRERGGEALAAPADVTQPGAIQAAREQAREWAGAIDHVAHVAGYPLEAELWDSPLHELDDGDFERVREVDLVGARRVTQAALPDVREAGGSMVYIASTPALSGYKGTPYTQAKAAVLGLVRDVAREYGPDGVRANALALGNIGTEATVEHTTDEYDELAREAALGRWGQPEEAARAIGFFLSPLSSFVTGQTLVVDGGAVMR
jgi:3-oxoacyl-[acyl-carrier protein] reductase